MRGTILLQRRRSFKDQVLFSDEVFSGSVQRDSMPYLNCSAYRRRKQSIAVYRSTHLSGTTCWGFYRAKHRFLLECKAMLSQFGRYCRITVTACILSAVILAAPVEVKQDKD